MELTELELMKKIKEQIIEAMVPYLKVQRPEGEPGEKDKPIFESLGEFIKSVYHKDARLVE